MRAVMLVVAALASCYAPDFAACEVHCGGHDTSCPNDLTCGDDHYCHAAGDSSTCVSLSVDLQGNGSGHVTSAPLGIDCTNASGSTCDAAFTSGTSVTLTEAAATGATFAHWGGAECNNSTVMTCTFAIQMPGMGQGPTVSATFN